MGRPGTINETAALVTQHGGIGIALRVDHTREDEVAPVSSPRRALIQDQPPEPPPMPATVETDPDWKLPR